MPLKLDSRDRRLMLGAGIAFFVLVAGAMILAGGEGPKLEIPTTYSTASGGAKAAYLLLQESGYKVERWERPLAELSNPPGKTLILAEPLQAPTREERRKLEDFISGGGRVIATGVFAGLFLPRASVIPNPWAAMTWKRVSALTPSLITRAAPQITLAPEASWGYDSSVLPLYGSEGKIAVIKYGFGRGEVIWWAAATPLTNAGLKEPGNLEFFLACLSDHQGREVIWDEYLHGYQQSLASTIARSSVKWIFVQFALLSLAILVTFSRRSGPIFTPAGDSRLSPLEFVHTLGGLYQRAGVASVAVDVSYQRFRYWLTRRLGMAGNTSVDDLDRAVRNRGNFKDEKFAATLRECESARYYPDLNPRQALRLVALLDDYAAKLKLFRRLPGRKFEWKRFGN